MKMKELLKGDLKLKIFVTLGIIGILLIFLSNFLPAKKDKKVDSQIVNQNTILTNEEYEKRFEQKISELIRSIEGVGEVKVMVTLQNGVENVYVTEEKFNTDKTNDSQQTVALRNSKEQKTLIVEDENGNRKALIQTIKEPTVKGVVIVCEGGDNILVQERVTEAVKIALGINSTRVCVTKLS